MTIRINFLPQTSRPQKRLGMKRWMPAAAAASVLVVGAGYYANVYSGTLGLEHRAETNQVLLSGVKKQLADASEIKAIEQRVQQEEQELKALTGRQWSGVLLDLRNLDPQHVVWTGLKTSENQITLNGNSDSLLSMAQLLGGLADDTEIAEVSLHFVNEKGIPVAVTVKPGDPAPAASPAPALLEPDLTRGRMEFELVITLVAAEGRPMTSAS